MSQSRRERRKAERILKKKFLKYKKAMERIEKEKGEG
jgi:hypothetical protein